MLLNLGSTKRLILILSPTIPLLIFALLYHYYYLTHKVLSFTQELAGAFYIYAASSYGGGLELRVWSELAQGSGLGGSSLLAGTILAVLFTVMGYNLPSTRELIHATLGVEQLLTTGGGWQDQVGGLIGGIKLGVSFPKIPLVVNTFSIPLTEDLLTFLNQRLLLVYTGKVRLARNLLQTVLRNWYAGETRISSCFQNLRTLALKTAESILNEDISLLGSCIDEYWVLKKSVASGCEPEKVQKYMKKIRTSGFRTEFGWCWWRGLFIWLD
ncbi:L-fucose kinase [Armadillidium vulgare]|nr:L-fucose kinase [Armadillidium vulgare]